MYTVRLTLLLRETLKEIRKQNKLRGDMLSKELGKGAAYISKIESGKIKEIRIDAIITLFQSIARTDKKSFSNYIICLIDNIIDKKNIISYEKEEWIQVFDAEFRLYSIPHTLIKYISDSIKKQGITARILVQRINHSVSFTDSSIPYNKVLQPISFKHSQLISGSHFNAVRFDLPIDYVEQVLNCKVSSINYAFMAGILFYLLSPTMPLYTCLETCHSILYNNNFFTIAERHLTNNIPSIEENILNNFTDRPHKIIEFKNNTSIKTPSSLNSEVDFFAEDPSLSMPEYSNHISALKEAFTELYHLSAPLALAKVTSIEQNLKEDLAFSTALMSSSIRSISPELRKDFWNEYQALLNKYISKSEK